MTSSSTSSSFVGTWTISANPANATMPICVPLVLVLDEGRRRPPRRRRAGSAGCRSRTCSATRPSRGRPSSGWSAPGRSPPAGPSRTRDSRARARTARTAGGGGSATTAGRRRGRATGSRTARRSAGDAAPRSGRRRAAAARRGARAGSATGTSWHPPEPAQRRDATDQEQREPERREQRRQLERLGADHEPAADVVVDRARGRPRPRPRSTCRRSVSAMSWSAASSSWVWTRKPSTSSVVPAALPIPTVSMRMPRSLRGLRRLERVRLDGVLAVGQQHDDRRLVDAGRDRRRLRPSAGRRRSGSSRSSIGSRSPLDDRRAPRGCRGPATCRAPARGAGSRPRARRGRRSGPGSRSPVSLKTTIPMRTEPAGRSMNASAAVLAASIRVGATSVAAMLPETSNARRTVPSSRGTPMTLCGRASEKTRIVMPSDGAGPPGCGGSTVGRRGGRPPTASPVAAAPAEPRRPRRPPPLPRRYSHTPTGIARRSSRSGGQMNDIGLALRSASGARPSGRSPRAGRRRSRARPRRPRRAGTRPPAPPRARRAASSNRRRNFGSCVSTYSCSPVSASSMSIGPTSGSSVSRRSYSRIAMTSCFRVSPSSARSQPGALMKSEITNTSERPLIQRWPGLEQRRRDP